MLLDPVYARVSSLVGAPEEQLKVCHHEIWMMDPGR